MEVLYFYEDTELRLEMSCRWRNLCKPAKYFSSLIVSVYVLYLLTDFLKLFLIKCIVFQVPNLFVVILGFCNSDHWI